ncbi:hypothetical protein C8R44DRAFT_895021 [Mycena epipterygia]|nr:hypothetical protein C8R44DRAFT_895021 [Mycena epipterygia]
MQDVQVQRRKRKRRVPRFEKERDTESDLEEQPATQHQRTDSAASASKSGKPRKKRTNRKQSSRSIRNLAPSRQQIVKASYGFLQKAVVLYFPWPKASPSGDPSADDDEFEGLIENAWEDSIDFLDLDPDEVEDRTEQESRLMRARISQVWSDIMTQADLLVPAAYGLIHLESLADPTPENIAATRESNRQLVEDLDGTFVYEDPKQTSDMATIGRNTVFQKLCTAALFGKKKANRRGHYFAGLSMLPIETMALLMDAVICAIHRWRTGEYKMVPFEGEVYATIHHTSIEFLNAWLTEYANNAIHPEDLARGLLRDMLVKARAVSNTPAETVQTSRSMFPMGVFAK